MHEAQPFRMDLLNDMKQVLRGLGEDSSYYEFLRDHYPIGKGLSMEMELQPDADELESDEFREIFFVLRRRPPRA